MRNDKQIVDLLGDNCVYKLNKYLQRPYEWEKDRVVKFIRDIVSYNYYGGNNFSIKYNIGDFMTYRDPDNVKLKWLYDGQQRMTTFTLALVNILHHKPSKKTMDTMQGMLRTYIWNENGKADWGRKLILRDDDDVILGKIVENGLAGLNGVEKRNCLAINYKLISEEFTDKMSQSELDEFFEKLTSMASYFERECESEIEGMIQFNNLNAGQQSLKEGRKGISALFPIFYKQSRNNLDAERMLYKLSNQKDDEVRRFLALYIYYKTGNYKERGFSYAINKMYRGGVDVLASMHEFDENIYSVLKKHEECNPFLSVQYMRLVYIDIFTDKNSWHDKVDDADKAMAYLKMEWGYIGYTFRHNDRAAFKNVASLMGAYDPSFGTLTDYVSGKLMNSGAFIMPAENLKVIECGTQPSVVTKLLLRVEEEFAKELPPNYEPVLRLDQTTLEHIHPIHPKKGCVYQCGQDKTNKLGNLTLMGRAGNSHNSSKTFEEKRESYKESPYLLNKKHLCNYAVWDDAAVDNRADWIVERVKRIYHL